MLLKTDSSMKEIPCWMAISHLPNWSRETINRLVIKIVHNHKIKLTTFFSLFRNILKEDYHLSDSQILAIQKARKGLATYSFLMESFLGLGYEIIPLTSSRYPITLKQNLKIQYAPTILYMKGNRKLLRKEPIKFFNIADNTHNKLRITKDLTSFVENIVKKAVDKKQPILLNPYSTKSIDKQIITSCFKLGGKGIMVMPKGIMTCSEIFDKYYQQIFSGNLLIVSSCHPKQDCTPNTLSLSKVLSFGLAAETYVTTIDTKNEAWYQLLTRIKQGELVYVREPNESENTLNAALIRNGAISIGEDDQEESDVSLMPATLIRARAANNNY